MLEAYYRHATQMSARPIRRRGESPGRSSPARMSSAKPQVRSSRRRIRRECVLVPGKRPGVRTRSVPGARTHGESTVSAFLPATYSSPVRSSSWETRASAGAKRTQSMHSRARRRECGILGSGCDASAFLFLGNDRKCGLGAGLVRARSGPGPCTRERGAASAGSARAQSTHVRGSAHAAGREGRPAPRYPSGGTRATPAAAASSSGVGWRSIRTARYTQVAMNTTSSTTSKGTPSTPRSAM